MKNQKLKINYPKQNRIPEGAAQLANREKKAQQRAQKQPRKRHKLQDFDLVTIDAPQEFPAFDNDFTLRDPSLPDISPLLSEIDFVLSDPKFNFSSPDFKGWEFIRRLFQMPNFKGWEYKPKNLNISELNIWKLIDRGLDIKRLNELLLKKVKFDLGDLWDFSFNYFNGIGYPVMPTFEPQEEIKVTEAESTLPHIKNRTGVIYEHSTGIHSNNGIWNGACMFYQNNSVVEMYINLIADPDSDITDDYVTIPELYGNISDADAIEAIVNAYEGYEDWEDYKANLKSCIIEVPHSIIGTPSMFYSVERKSNTDSGACCVPPYHPYADYPLPTNITVSLQGQTLHISENFTCPTQDTKCKMTRVIRIWLVGYTDKPAYMNWRKYEQQP